jgi:hypothetical protein
MNATTISNTPPAMARRQRRNCTILAEMTCNTPSAKNRVPKIIAAKPSS